MISITELLVCQQHIDKDLKKWKNKTFMKKPKNLQDLL